MGSRKASRPGALLAKDLRELLASRAAWFYLLLLGPLVGHAFTTAVALYAEASGSGGGPAALPQGLNPLDGIVVPTLGAYDLAVTLLFPFVAIRLVSSEKESGALALLLQSSVPLSVQLGVKALALALFTLVSFVPGALALALWKSYGGHLAGPETSSVFAGHLLHAALAAGVAFAAAALTEGAASAALVTLAFTIGTWALDFVAAGRGGLAAAAARFTPAAVLRQFEQGLLPLGPLLGTLAATSALLVLAAIWLHGGTTVRGRLARSLALVGVCTAAGVSLLFVPASRDLSEDRRSSFSSGDEELLRRLRGPLTVTIHLAPEDPRLEDFERGVLVKLRRTLPSTRIVYAATSRTGLFETDRYGEIEYVLAGKRAVSRSTTEPIVLDEILRLGGLVRGVAQEPAYPGYPLAVRPRGAALLFYGLWPMAAGLAWLVFRSQWS